MKRTLCALLTLTLVLLMCVPAFAEETTYSITVTNSKNSITINGNTYNAYKLFDATYTDTSTGYTLDPDFADFTYTVGDKTYQGNDLIVYVRSLTSDSDALDAFAKAALNYITTKSVAADGTAVAASKSATINLTAPGYYLVTGTATAPDNQTVTAACMLDTAAPTVTINVKADAPSIDKKIVEGSSKVDANTSGIGKVVNYEITTKVPDMKGYTKYFFVIEDTLSKGLTFNDDLVVKLDGTALTKDTDYTLTATINQDGTTSLKIVFKNFVQYKAKAGKDIVVTYSATVNEKADLSQTGNDNKVHLIYSNNPNQAGEGQPGNPDEPGDNDSKGQTPDKVVKTYVTGLKVKKVDETGVTLTGAKFQLSGTAMKVVLVNEGIFVEDADGGYYMLKDGTYTATAPAVGADVDNSNYDSITTKYKKIEVVNKTTVPTSFTAVGWVNANGVLTFEGLGEGTYTLTELVAPDGRNLLDAPITITVKASNVTIDSCTWTVKAGETSLTAEDNLYVITVVNSEGMELPETGGMGTTVFYVVGGLMVLVAVVLLVTKKKMSSDSGKD